MNGLLGIFRRGEKRRAAVSGRARVARQRREAVRSQVESLERRTMLAVDISQPAPGELLLLYNQPDPITGAVDTTDQHVTVEIENAGTPAVTRVNVYVGSDPDAVVFTGIGLITVTVPNFDTPGVNGNSLTIKGINSASDRIIMTGGGRTAAGRWSDQTATDNQVLLAISGIDDLTLTAGGIINVSGAFTNDTTDASIKAFGTVPEHVPEQYSATVVVAETTPVPGTLPQPGLVSNFIEIVGAELDILGDIEATDQVILRAGEKAAAPQSLVLPYDVTVSGSLVTPTPGRLELYSTKNIVQLQGSTLTAGHLVAVSNDADADAPGGPWMIDLGSENNDFDTIALGMISAPGDAADAATEGRIGIRDRDDLNVTDFGILAATGQVRIDAAGALTFSAPIQATGLVGESDHSITSTAGAIMRLGVLGLELYANDSFDDTATGDVTLRGPVIVDKVDAEGVRDTTLVSNKIQASGKATIVGGIYSPLAGSTTISANAGIIVDGPIQVGSTQLNTASTAATVFDHDLLLISHAGAITVNDRPGGDAVPRTIQATNIVSFDAADTITIAGSVFAGTIYGNATALTATQALPAITIIGDTDVIVAATGSLETQAYENNAETFSNPLLGRISIDAATQFDLQSQGWIKADGPLDITSHGDIYLYGTTTARESIDVETREGSLDIQGAVRTTGWTYTGTPPAPLAEQRRPDIILAAPQGGITTSVLGTISAGTMTVDGVDVYGEVILQTQQDIVIGADVDTDGGFTATSTLGEFELGALLRTGRDLVAGTDLAVTIKTNGAISEAEFGQIQTERLDLTVVGTGAAADITLTEPGNRIDRLLVRNFSPGGATTIINDTVYDSGTNGPVLDLSLVDVVGDFTLTSTSTIGMDGVVQSTQGDITVTAQSGGINVQSTVRAPGGAVKLEASGQIVQRGGNVTTLYLLSGGRNYSYAIITVDPPPGAGDRALVSATITPYPRPPGDGIRGAITALNLLNGGWGYPSGSRVAIAIDGDGEGAAAVAETSIVTSSIEARDDVTLTGGDGITLVSAVRSSAGNVAIATTLGDISVQSITAGKAVDVGADRGKVTLVTVQANEGVTLDANQGLRVTGSVNTTGGDIALDSANGDLTFVNEAISGEAPQAVLYAPGGDVALTSRNGGIVSPFTINAGKDVKLTSFNTLELTNEITSQGGDILATSTSGRISLASNLVAETGSIRLESQTSMIQQSRTGVTFIELLSAGQISDQAPQVTVTVAPPRAGGGRPATAAALIERRQLQNLNNQGTIDYEYFIGSIVVLDPGEGYAVGEQPLVTITGVNGALARAYGPTALQMVMAQKDITVDAGENLTLITKVHSVEGDILISSKTGNIDLSSDTLLVSTKTGTIDIVADRGSATIERLAGGGNVNVDALQGVVVENNLYSASGTISVTSRNDMAEVGNLNAGTGVTVQSFKSLTLEGEIAAQTGDVSALSTSGGIFLNANVVAETGKISLESQTFLLQGDATGIETVQVIDRGSVIQAAGGLAPTVTITIAPPRQGGDQATAVAVLGKRTTGNAAGNEQDEWYIASIRITNPGRGYQLGENPVTTVEGMGQAIVQAIGPTNIRNLSAQTGIDIKAGNDVTLLYAASAKNGNVTIESLTGDLLLGANGVLLQALSNGTVVGVGSVTLKAECGDVIVERICADEDITIEGETGVTIENAADAGGKIDLSAGIGNVKLVGEVTAETGAVTVTSTSGGVLLSANINAIDDVVTLRAHGGVTQTAGSGLREIQVLSGGESATDAIPVVTVTIAAPASGGVAATAYAVLESFTNVSGDIRWKIASIVLLTPGRGYAIGESPVVTISNTITGAAALAIGPTGYQDIVADEGVSIVAGQTVELVNTVRSNTGNISISSIDGSLQLGTPGFFAHALDGSIVFDSDCGEVVVQKLCAENGGIDISGEAGVTVLVSAVARDDITLTAGIGNVALNGQVESQSGNIQASSASADVRLSANVHAIAGDITVKAHNGVSQTVDSGLSSVTVLFGGESATGVAPVVTVIITSPAAGGEAAKAYAVLKSFTNVNGQTRFTVDSIVLTDPGRGYTIGERPVVTVTGIDGVAALANGPDGYQSVVAAKNLTVGAGDDILITNTWRADTGAVRISSVGGDISSSGDLQASAGTVTLLSDCGDISVGTVCGYDDVTIIAEHSVELVGRVTSDVGDITVMSEAGTIFLKDMLNAAAGGIDIAANQGVFQSVSTGIVDIRVLAVGAVRGGGAPTPTVNIAAPRNGGVAASATAIVTQVGSYVDAAGVIQPIWGVTDIVISNPGSGYAIGENPFVTVTGIGGVAAVAVGPQGYKNIAAAENITVTAGEDVEIVDSVRSINGDITIKAKLGDVTLSAASFIAHAEGDVTLASDCGAVAVRNVCAGDAVQIDGELQVRVFGEVSSDRGDLSVRSRSGTVFLSVNMHAEQGAITVAAHGGVTQTDGSGLRRIQVVYGGQAVTTTPPAVTVTIAPPATGGVAATAIATVSQVSTNNAGTPIFAVTAITITNPGSGYALDETPAVSVAGIGGVTALAIGPDGYQDIVAQTTVTISAIEAVTLRNLVKSKTDSVTIESDCSTVEMTRACAELDVIVSGSTGVTVGGTAEAGRDIVVTAPIGPATVTNLTAGDAITVTSQNLTSLNGVIVATEGNIEVTSIAGAIDLNATVRAVNGSVILDAHQGVNSRATSTGISAIQLLNGGSVTAFARPVVTVEVAAPVNGTLATAVATVVAAGVDPVTNQTIWTISALTIQNPGSGYQPGETVAVTITGMPGAAARAIGPTNNEKTVVAHDNLAITAGEAIALRGTFRAETGNVTVDALAGNVDLSDETFLAEAVVGQVTLSSRSGALDLQKTSAGDDITVTAAGTVTLLGYVDSEAGDISITSRNRDLDFTASGAQLHALQGGVALSALNGTIMSPPTLHASTNVTLTSFNTLVLNNEITSDTGIIDLKSTSGSVNLGANLDARDDSIRINAKGSVTQLGGALGFVRVLNGGTGYTAAATVTIAGPSSGTGVAARGMPIIGTVNGVSGVITGIRITNPGSGYGAGEQPVVTFTRNATPPTGVTWIDANVMAIASPALGNSGLAAIDVLAGGSGYTATTTVTIAAPAAPGGTAATAQAVIGSVTVDGVTTDGVIVDIVIVNPGSGYGAGERPTVTITGAGAGATATAIAAITLQDIRAGQDIDIYAGTGVVLLNTIRADQGHVTITSESGNVNLAARTLLVSSFADDIEITARRGAIAVQRLAAEGDITLKAQIGVTLLNAVNSTGEFGEGNVSIYTVNGNIAAVAPTGLISVQNGGVSLESVNGSIFVPQVFNVSGNVSLKTFGNLTVTQPLTSTANSVTLASATGAVTLAANVFAQDRVTISAKTGITQTKGFMQGAELVARNASTSAVAIGNALNDFQNVSVMSLGAVAYVDANDFETGVERDGAPLGVEMMGSDLAFSSVAPYSRIRVVSGLSYRTLSIAAGTQSNLTRGYVEYVTTSEVDNPTGPFAGTLRDMIRYVNDNTASYLNPENTRVPQPQMMVFDEQGYTVNEVKLGAALPAFAQPVFFDGGRLEETASVDRLGIAGTSAIAYGLAFAPAIAAVPGKSPAYPGSAGSTLQHVAAYGFSKGSAVVLGSGNNRVLDLHAGLRADGSVAGNFVGLDVSGATAVNNQIGSAVFDIDAVNRFAGNSSAGILIRNGAVGTRVYGSVIGDDTGYRPELANGDGIRISNATGNWIGTPDEVQIDLTPSRSNWIMGNKAAGIQISNSVAGTLGAANVVRNNYLAGNATGVGITASRFAVLGGLDERSANVVVGQTGIGVAVADSMNVQLRGNRVGILPAFGFDAEDVRGNGADGIAITGKSSAVEISGGNWIGANQGNGVSIGTGATGVTLTGNRIGGLLTDGSPAGNGRDGVAITAAIGNVVGIGNVISENARHGVSVTDARAATVAAGNSVVGSTIADNKASGVFVSGGGGLAIGGATAGTGNVITGNANHGIRVERSMRTGAATNVAIQGNFVGTNTNAEIDDPTIDPILLGNAQSGISLSGVVGAVVNNRNTVMNNAVSGIEIVDGSAITIGAATAAAGNLITNNPGDGVTVSGKATAITVMGNEIAEQGGDGVEIGAGVRGVRIGQTVTQQAVTGAGNVFRENAGWGVRVGAGAQQIGVQGNTFLDNGLGAISMATTANSAAPLTVSLTSAIMRTASGGVRQLVLTGTLAGPGIQARQQYSVDVYASPAADLAPNARRFLGRFTLTATTAGRISFSNIVLTANVAVNEQITATATSLVFDPGSTSRFSGVTRARLR